ncbi:PfkB family carbohydrate kinase [Kocuria kalidii]|uniref:sugar kinase n=1 Tax=Kocuria kalidii TaxID=3376283 RepID=UPI0037A371FE
MHEFLKTPGDGPAVLCLGETMALVAPVRAESLETAQSFVLSAGGAESTVALYLAGAGHRAAWLSRVGDDPLGRRLLRQLRAHGVDTSLVGTDTEAPTGVYFKDPGGSTTTVHYYRSGSAASAMGPAVLQGIDWTALPLLHLSGITAGLSPSCRALLDAAFTTARAHGTLVSFDVNHRPGLWSAEEAGPVLAEYARRADIVFVGRDEAETLWRTGDPDTLYESLGTPRHLVVKDGAVGATDVSATGTVFVPAQAVEVVEVVGAGDAFAAGYLSGLLHGERIEARLGLGHALAARALSSVHDFDLV